MHGLNTLEHQPQKIAAMEGIWQTERGAPLLLFALPERRQRAATDFAIGVPNVASLILTHEADGEIKGLDEFEGAPSAGGAAVLRPSASWSASAC